MADAYYIVDFEHHYVSSEMRRRKITRPTWFKCPANPSPRAWHLINSHENGLAHLGVWSLMQGWAVRHFIRTNGRFVDAKTGTALSTTTIAMELGLPGKTDLVAETLARLCEIGWVASEAEISGAIQTHPDASRQRERESREREKKKNLLPVTRNVSGQQVASEHPTSGASGNTQRRDQGKAAEHEKSKSSITWSPGNGWTGISTDDLTRWSEAYPLLDIQGEILRSSEWLRARPGRAKRYKNFGLMLNKWLANNHEGVAARGARRSSSPQARATALDKTREGRY